MNDRRHELDKEYRATEYRVDQDDVHLTLRIDETNPSLDRLLGREHQTTWAYLTACNPDSRPLSTADNDARMKQLTDELVAAGYTFLDGAGVGADPDWVPEPSVLILGIELTAARDIARRFGQLAILCGERGGPVRLIWTADDSARSAPG